MCRFDARAWVAWAAVAALIAMQARNPLYTLMVLIASRIVAAQCTRPDREAGISFWRLSLVILTFSATFNALSAHIGETILFRLPAGWPLIGGTITLEGFVVGLINGLALLALLSIFLAVNAIVPVSDLVRLVPRAFHELGVVLLVALTYVPETVRHLGRIRDAQAVRGHQLRGLRDWRPLVVPLLLGGLERAMQLAEVMVARGYGSTTGKAQSTLRRVGLVLGLTLALVGWGVVLFAGWPGWLVLGSALAILAAIVWRAGKEVRHTTYRPRTWRQGDSAFLLASIGLTMILLLAGLGDGFEALTFLPYPRLYWPPFEPLLGLALLLLLYPLAGSRRTQS